ARLLLGQRISRRARNTLALAILRQAHADAHALARLGVVEHDVRQVDRRLLLEDAALLRLAARPRVALHEVHLLHDDPALRLVHRQHAAGLPLVVTGDHHDGVALADLQAHQITSGASEMIFMNCFSRSSRATGPKMRVPRGSFSLLMRTTAFSSKRMYDPSLRRISLRARTTTAFATSP